MNLVWFKIKQKIKKIKPLYIPIRAYKDKVEKKEWDKKCERLQNDGFLIVSKISKALEKSNIEYFYTYGTLLGLIREGGFIKHDNDIDLGVLKTKDFSWNTLNKLLNDEGFSLLHQFSLDGEVTEQTYIFKGMTIDFFAYEKEVDKMISYSYFNKNGIINEDPRKKFVTKMISREINRFTYLDVDGCKYRIPSNSEEYLEDIYGELWKIPNPDWKDEESPAWNELEGKFGMYEKIK